MIFEIVNGVYITLNRSGSDLLFRALRRSTIGTKTFHFRVRDGTGWDNLVITTRSIKSNISCLILNYVNEHLALRSYILISVHDEISSRLSN